MFGRCDDCYSHRYVILRLTVSLLYQLLDRAKSQSDHGAKRAEEILDLMGRMVEGGDISVAPDVHSFSTVINGALYIRHTVIAIFGFMAVNAPAHTVSFSAPIPLQPGREVKNKIKRNVP